MAICSIQSGNQTFLTGGNCAEIPGLGSPILMVSNVHKYIEDALHIKNNYTVAKYIFYNKIASVAVPGQATYQLAFNITDYNGTRFLGVDLTISPFGIGSVKINKFILTKSLAVLKQAINASIVDTSTISCGDLKFVYSSFGNDPTADLNYVWPGRNYNSGGLHILNELNQTTAKPSNNKVCTTSHFIKTLNFFGTPGAGTPVNRTRCLPQKNPVATISVGCSGGVVVSLQLTFHNQHNNGTTTDTLMGNPSTSVSQITHINLDLADRISFTSFTTPASLKIETLDSNNTVLKSFTCGTGVTAANNVIISANDFLGFADITTDNIIIQSFELSQYDD